MKLTVLFLCLFSFTMADADEVNVQVVDKSTTGKTLRISLAGITGLNENDPVLFRKEGKDLALGRVMKIDERGTVISIKDGREAAVGLDSYTMVFGVPLMTAPNLPDYIADRDSVPANPGNEQFFTADGRELGTPELDDDNYTPEVTLKPKLPESRTFSPHGITIGFGLFRNRALSTASSPGAGDSGKNVTYQGYSFRYGYTFPTYIWLRTNHRALISTEFSVGIYNFGHTFGDGTVSDIRVIPLGLQLRYQVELSKLFRLYPYVGYQNNIVSSTKSSASSVNPLAGGRLLGGGGAQLVFSDTMDGRLEAGSDGIHFGLMVKF